MKQHQRDAFTKRKARQLRKTIRAEIRIIERASVSVTIGESLKDGIPLQMPVITGTGGRSMFDEKTQTWPQP